jgi:glycosyltransferase involved in cell wall biosynthesis
MRIAAIIPGLPEPADRGTYKRYAAVVAMLCRLGTVDCCTLVDQDLAPGAEAIFRARVARLHAPRVAFQPWKGLLGQWRDPLAPNVRHWFDPAIVEGIRAFFAGHDYDVVLLGDLVSIPYAEAVGLDRFPCWLDRARVDIEFQRQSAGHRAMGFSDRVKDALRRRLTARYERHASAFAAGEIVCAPSDRAALLGCVGAGGCPIRVVANGIEGDLFPDQGEPVAEPAFMVAGAMDYQPNAEGLLWFVHGAWPLIRARVPAATLAVVGRDPLPALRALDGKDGIRVTGAVPSMLPEYARARVVVAPIRIGGGTRLKVVECWSVGRALVGTTIAVDGLDAVHDRNCLIGDTPAALAEACCAALAAPANARLRAGALATAAKYSWDAVWRDLEAEWTAMYGRAAP